MDVTQKTIQTKVDGLFKKGPATSPEECFELIVSDTRDCHSMYTTLNPDETSGYKLYLTTDSRFCLARPDLQTRVAPLLSLREYTIDGKTCTSITDRRASRISCRRAPSAHGTGWATDHSTYHYYQADGVPRQGGFYASHSSTQFPVLVDTPFATQRIMCMVHDPSYMGVGKNDLGAVGYYLCGWYGKQACPAKTTASIIDSAPGNVCNNYFSASSLATGTAPVPPAHTIAQGILRKQRYHFDMNAGQVSLKIDTDRNLLNHPGDEYMYAPRQCSRGDAEGWIVNKAGKRTHGGVVPSQSLLSKAHVW